MRSRLSACLSVLSLVVIGGALGAAELFFDDFEGYVDTSEMTAAGWQVVEEGSPVETGAAWTIALVGSRGTPGTANGTPSTGNYVLSDSDAAGGADQPCTGRSHDLWSPSFSCTGAPSVWLHFDCTALLNNNGKVVFDVDVSKDLGATWTNVFRRVAPERIECAPLASIDNTDGFVGRLDLDISAVAGNQADVQVRFRQFEPDDDWWIGVDNVVVDEEPAVQGGDKTLLRLEDFEASIPGAWSIVSLAAIENTGKLTWTTEDPCKRSAVRWAGGNLPYQGGQGAHRLGAGFAVLESETCPGKAAVDADEYLITPVLDCRNAAAVYLHYRDEIVVGGGAREVLLSLDGGTTFETEPIFNYNAGAGILGEDSLYAQRVFDVALATGEERVAFAFHFASGAGSGWWGVDDVKVSASGAALPAEPPVNCGNRRFRTSPFDAAANAITCSWDSLPGDQIFRLLRNGVSIAGDLPATTLSFIDTPIPPGTATVSYALQTVVGGTVVQECRSREVSPLVCPENLVCCVNPSAQQVHLTWNAGFNIAGTGWRITRNGVPVRTVAIGDSSYTDTVPGPGEYRYELILNGGDAAQCPNLPLQCRARVQGGALPYIFFEDFEDYEDDTDLNGSCWEIHEVNSPAENAAWSIMNPGGRGNPPLVNGTASEGKFLISDSDAADNADGQGSGRSHDIWSPPFSCAGKQSVWLHMDTALILNNNGLCIFDVDVSTDNGANWTNVFRRIAPGRSADPRPVADIPAGLPGGPQVGNADGYFGRLDLDISAQAANKPHVRLRLRDFEPDDDWWMAVDDILVDDVPAVGGATDVVAESFDDGIPSTWQVVSTVGELAPWEASDPCNTSLLNLNSGQFYPLGDPNFPDAADGRRNHHLDDHFVQVYRSGEDCATALDQDEYLLTPSLDLSAATSAYLHFKSALLVTGTLAEVLLSLDGGETYDIDNPVFSYHREAGLLRDGGNADMIYTEHFIEVPEALGESDVVFAFHYQGTSSGVAGWAIDDVRVSADGLSQDPVFHRGDSNNDGKHNISDPVNTLNVLFLGSGAIPCQEAADSNDDGLVNISDPVNSLNVLFLGVGIVPPPLPPEALQPCGPDPTAETPDLGCASYSNC